MKELKAGAASSPEQFFKLPGLVKLTNTEPFAAWFVVSGDATADEIRVVRSVLGAISCHQAKAQAAGAANLAAGQLPYLNLHKSIS